MKLFLQNFNVKNWIFFSRKISQFLVATAWIRIRNWIRGRIRINLNSGSGSTTQPTTGSQRRDIKLYKNVKSLKRKQQIT
jgi:hypothetical protein